MHSGKICKKYGDKMLFILSNKKLRRCTSIILVVALAVCYLMNKEGLFQTGTSSEKSLNQCYAAVNTSTDQVHPNTKVGENADQLTSLFSKINLDEDCDLAGTVEYLSQEIANAKKDILLEFDSVKTGVEGYTGISQRYDEYQKEILEQFSYVEGKLEDIKNAKDNKAAQELINDIKNAFETDQYQDVLSELPYQVVDGEAEEEEVTGVMDESDYAADDNNSEENADLEQTSETVLSEVNQEKTKELKTALDVYNYVRNNITYEPYYGSRKGADGTLSEKSGNDMNQASLLIALLRERGISSHYVRGQARLTVEQAMEWTASDDIDAALDILASLGVPTVALTNAGKVAAVQVEHIWVEAYVPYSDYRGSGSNIGEEVWVPLDPNFKECKYYEGADVSEITGVNNQADSLEYEDGYVRFDTEAVSRVDVNNVLDVFDSSETVLENYLKENGFEDKDLIETFGGKKIVQQEEIYLPLSLPYQVSEVLEEFSAISEAESEAVTIAVRGNSTTGYTISGSNKIQEKRKASDLYGKRIILAWAPATEQDASVIAEYGDIFHVPAYLVNMVPQLLVDGEVVAAGTECGLGYKQEISITVSAPTGEEEVITNQVTVGGMYCIALDYGTTSADELSAIHTDIEELKATVNEDNIYSESAMGEILNAVAKSYFAQLDLYNAILAGQNHVTQTRGLSVGMTGYSVAVQYMFQIPSEVTEGNIYIDIDHDVKSVVSNDAHEELDNEKAFMLQSGYFASAMEHRVLEQMTGVESVSTIKALQVANEKGISICTISKENYASMINTLSVSQAVKDDIYTAVSNNKLVIIPQEEVQIYDWSGSGYIVLDTETFAAGYMISGGLAGGSMTVSQVLDEYVNYVINGLIGMIIITIIEAVIAALLPGGWAAAIIWGIRIVMILQYIQNVYMLVQLYQITGEPIYLQEICIQIAAMCTLGAIRLGPAKQAFDSLQTFTMALTTLIKTGASSETCMVFIGTYGVAQLSGAESAIGVLQRAGCSDTQIATIGSYFNPSSITAVETAFAKIGVISSSEIDAVIILFKQAGSAGEIVSLGTSLSVVKQAGFSLNEIGYYGVNSISGIHALANVVSSGITLGSIQELWNLGIPVTKFPELGINTESDALTLIENGGQIEENTPGVYNTTIKWGVQTINARSYGEGYWGERIPQANPRVDALELKVNPNDESYYLPLDSESMVQFENMSNAVVQDAKCIMSESSFYHVLDKPAFLQNKVLAEANRQVAAADKAGYQVEWLVSEQKAVEQLTQFFQDKNIDITVTYFPE